MLLHCARLVLVNNTIGTICYATAGPNTRTTQLFINYANNTNLNSQGMMDDAQASTACRRCILITYTRTGFAPFGYVTDGWDVVTKIYSGYGQSPIQVSLSLANGQ
jgi:peptidyl-prolyl cis-trans isomerase A (cyclophilin A)